MSTRAQTRYGSRPEYSAAITNPGRTEGESQPASGKHLTTRKIFFSVGEPSGDLHGSNLIRQLKENDPNIGIVGFGGPRMHAAGMSLLEDLTQLAVMWLAQAALNIHRFWLLLRRAERYFREERPDAVVLIDYPGFNWWIARAAKKHGIRVFYYGVPQMWAWGGWRVAKMRRLVDHVLCKLPFEAAWYQERGCHARYVGHPYFDELTSRQANAEFLHSHAPTDAGRLVTILPGSRTQEVRANLPCFLQAARRIATAVPGTRFAIAGFNQQQADLARAVTAESDPPIDVYVDKTCELIQLSHCCIACSGSVSLELMYYAKPSVIHYRTNRGMYHFARLFLLQVKYMTLVNLLACEDRYDVAHAPYEPGQPGAEQVPFPEYPACVDKSAQIASHVIEWLTDAAAYRRRVDQLVELRTRFCTTGATFTAAKYILEHLSGEPPVHAVPRVPGRAA